MVSRMEWSFAVGLRAGCGNRRTCPSALYRSIYPGKMGFGSRPSEHLAKGKTVSKVVEAAEDHRTNLSASPGETSCLYGIVTTTTQELETIRSSTRARDIFYLGVFTEQLGPPKSPLPRCPPACANTEFECSDSVQSGMVTVRNRFASVSLLLVDGCETDPDDASRSLVWPPCFYM